MAPALQITAAETPTPHWSWDVSESGPSLQGHTDALGLELGLQPAWDLHGQPLLATQVAREQLHARPSLLSPMIRSARR
jgi:hypothetical protein